MTEKEKMLAGELYNHRDPELVALHRRAQILYERLNATPVTQPEKRKQIISELFGSAGKNCHVESSFKCDYGFNIHVGDNFYMNYDCVILDVAEVRIGKNCLVAPQVGIYTATHPLCAEQRAAGMESAAPVTIGDNCWIGGNATILPGVTLGNNVVVGGGSVVTK